MTEYNQASRRSTYGTLFLVAGFTVAGLVAGMAFGEQHARAERRKQLDASEKQRQELTETLKPKTPEERAREEYAFEIRYNAEKMRLTEPKRKRACEAEAKRSLLSEVAFRKNDEGELECMHRSRCTSDGEHCGEWMRWTP
jgi:cell division protein FtsN